MDPAVAKAALVRQYELLLVAQHRFLLADVISSLHGVACALQHAELLLLRTLQGSDTSNRKACSTGSPRAPQHQPQRPTPFQDAIQTMYTELKQLAVQVPVFLGDTELNGFVRALRDFTQSSGVDLFGDLPLDAQQQQLAETLTKDVVHKLERELETLEDHIARALQAATMLRKKRKHLAQLVDASLAIVERAQSSNTIHYEEKKAQLIVDFKKALRDPLLGEAKQIEHEIASIESSITTMLLPHMDACRPISAANARVTPDAELSETDCVQISAFVDFAMQLRDTTEGLSSVLNDAYAFLRRLTLFEKAAHRDAFVVCSSALKLNFHESLDDELFLAYVADRRDTKDKQREILASNEYADASQRVTTLKEAIMRVQISIQTGRKQVALDEPSKAMLVVQITDVFHEAGGDTSQMIQILP